MSISELYSPLPKPWCNINVNSINTGDDGGSNLVAPVTITAPSIATTCLTLNTETPTATGNCQALIIQNSDFGDIKLVVNNVDDHGQVWTTNGLDLITFTPSNILFIPNETGCLACNYESPGQTNVTVFSKLLLPTSGGTPSGLNYYEEYSQLYTFTGPWAVNYDRTITIIRIGRMCTVKIDAIDQNASLASNISITSGLPDRFRPTTTADSDQLRFQIDVIDNNLLVNGTLLIDCSSGLISISLGYTTTSPVVTYDHFSGTGRAGFDILGFSYVV